MSQLIKTENSVVTLKLVVSSEDFTKGIDAAYKKLRTRINIPGFRKGKAPKKIIETQYGKGVFYEEAINHTFPKAYSAAIDELSIDPIDQPAIEDVSEIVEGQDVEITVSVAVKPEVKLGDYKGVSVEKTETELKDEDVDAELAKMQEQASRLVNIEDRAVAENDMAIIDFEGFVDGEAFAGGKGENYSLTIGSNTFIPGFEEQLVGKNIGEEVEVNVTFPEEYHAENLAGKEAMFKVVIKEIKLKEMPELDDEFAKDVSEFDTLAELKEDVKAKLVEDLKKKDESENRNKTIDKVTENAEVEIPDVMVETEVENMVKDFEMRLMYQGMNLESYLKFTNSTKEDLKEQMAEEAKIRVKTSLVLEAIAKAEAVEVEEADVDAFIADMAKSYNMDLEKFKTNITETERANMKENVVLKKTIDILYDNAVIA